MVKPKMTKVSSSYKYASKQTGAVLDKLIEAQLSKTKKQTKVSPEIAVVALATCSPRPLP